MRTLPERTSVGDLAAADLRTVKVDNLVATALPLYWEFRAVIVVPTFLSVAGLGVWFGLWSLGHLSCGQITYLILWKVYVMYVRVLNLILGVQEALEYGGLVRNNGVACLWNMSSGNVNEPTTWCHALRIQFKLHSCVGVVIVTCTPMLLSVSIGENRDKWRYDNK